MTAYINSDVIEKVLGLDFHPNLTLLDVIEKFSVSYNRTLNPTNFLFYYLNENVEVYQTYDDLLNYKNKANISNLDMSFPLKYLKMKELLLIQKHFLDIPVKTNNLLQTDGLQKTSLKIMQSKKDQTLCGVLSPKRNLTEDEVILNEITIALYKVIVN